MTGPSHASVALDAEIRAANEASMLAREKARDAARAPAAPDPTPPAPKRREPARRAAVQPSPSPVPSPSPAKAAPPKPGPTADGGLVLSPSEAKAMVEMMESHPDYQRYTRPKGTRR